MDRLLIRNVRCFTNPKPARLAPLTLLVGANSTGKTTFLALARLARAIAEGNLLLDFNEPPFLLGAYDQIAHYHGGRQGRSKEFEIGFEADIPGPERVVSRRDRSRRVLRGRGIVMLTVVAKFRSDGSQPRVSNLSISAGSYKINVSFGKTIRADRVNLKSKKSETAISFDELLKQYRFVAGRHVLFMLDDLLDLLSGHHSRLKDWPDISRYASKFSKRDFSVFHGMVNFLFSLPISPLYASAPIRTEPQRTYNPVDDSPKPEGGHVPMVLAKTSFESGRAWDALKKSLDDFGKASNLFESLAIRRLGRHVSEPFQIKIKISGPPANLVDVGYGVSQVLPLLVDILRARGARAFFLQQPEIHLHPSGQAELGTFLGLLAKHRGHRFIVETHSDYLVDRVRMDVRDKKTLRPEDVAILFFERIGPSVEIQEIKIDENGNLKDVPQGYRRFFLKEDRRFLDI